MEQTLYSLWYEESAIPAEFALAQQPPAAKPQAFIDALRPAAQSIDARFGIPAGFIIAQAALESGWGRFVPRDIASGQYSYNLFGIKAKTGEPSVRAWSWEYIPKTSKWVRKVARFRAYKSYQESLEDHARLLTSPRYAACLSKAADAAEYARCIHRAGYATDPRYAEKLISIMRTWNLLSLRAALPPPPSWDPAAEVAWLKQQKLIKQDHDHWAAVTWGEFATVLHRMIDGMKAEK